MSVNDRTGVRTGKGRMKKRIASIAAIFVVLASIALCLSGCARPASEPESHVSIAEIAGPDRIILGWTGDPATTQAVTWRTVAPARSPQAQIAPVEASRDFVAAATATPAETMPVVADGKTVYHYEADFQGLSPDTPYSYRVGDGAGWSEWNEFRTASAKPERFRFIYMGDVQHEISSLWSRTVRMAYRYAPDARFILYAGDIVEAGCEDSLWGEWCYAQGFIPRMIPILSAPGNHDIIRPDNDLNDKAETEVPTLWHAHLALPRNGPKNVPLLDEETYYVDYQCVRIISLDSNLYDDEGSHAAQRPEARQPQLAWFEEVLQSAGSRWIIVVHHHPIFSVGRKRDNAELRQALEPLYDKYHVDLVLQGHDHHYGRTQKIREAKIVAPDDYGTIYAVSVSGPKAYTKNPEFESLMAVTRGKTQMFQIIDVDETRLAYEAYSVTGERVDAFELRRNPGKPTSYVTSESAVSAPND